MTKNTTPTQGQGTEDETALQAYLRPTTCLNSDHQAITATVRALADGCTTDSERVGRIHHYVRGMPYDILASFRHLALGGNAASDVIEHGVAFCMGKASSFVALARAAGIPARIAFQTLDAPKMEFLSPEVRALWRGANGRPLPWHSLGEAYLHGRWVKLDATIDAPTASRFGKPYSVGFDGHTDIPTVEGPVLRENGSYDDYPPEVAGWYGKVARAVLVALDSAAARKRLTTDDELWAGPDPRLVRRRACRRSWGSIPALACSSSSWRSLPATQRSIPRRAQPRPRPRARARAAARRPRHRRDARPITATGSGWR